jgi:hypothetical protein
MFSITLLSTSALYFLIWLAIGIIIYAAYSYKSKREEEKEA